MQAPKPAVPAPTAGTRRPWLLEAGGAMVIAVLVAVLYTSTLNGPFVFDDVRNIENNAAMQLTELSLDGLHRAGFDSPLPTRFIANISFALNHLVHGYETAGYRIVNIAIHIITGLLLFYLVKTTLNLPALRDRYPRATEIALFTALLWLLHPVASQSVAYIVQRMNSLSVMFYLLSLLLYIRARLAENSRGKWLGFGGAVLTFLLALGSKEVAASLVGIVLLYEWYFLQDLNRDWLRRYTPLLVSLLLFALMSLWWLEPWNDYEIRAFTMGERLLTELRVVMHYISLWVFPHPDRLNLDYAFPISHSLFDPLTTLFSLLALLGVLGAAIYFARRERLLSFCILWFVVNLLIESTFISLEIIFEHRTYLPYMGLSLLTVVLVYRTFRHAPVRLAVLGVTAVLFAAWTYQRNTVWANDITLWNDVVKKSPGKSRGHNNLGFALSDRHDYVRAIGEFDLAIAIDPNNYKAVHSRGFAKRALKDNRGALEDYTRTIELKPDHKEVYYNRGNTRFALKDYQGATQDYSKALEFTPRNEKVYHNRASARLALRDYRGAIDDYGKALEINPSAVNSYLSRGDARRVLNDYQGALEDYSESLRLRPRSADVHFKRGLAQRALGDQQGYCDDLKRAAALGHKSATSIAKGQCQ